MKYSLLLLAGLALPAATLAQRPVKIKSKVKNVPATSAPAKPLKVVPPAGATADYATLYAERYITQDKLRRDLTILASDEYEGRETGTKRPENGRHLHQPAVQARQLGGPGSR